MLNPNIAKSSSPISRDAPSSLWRRLVVRPEAGVAIALIVIFIFFAIATSHTRFLEFNGQAAWLNIASQLGIIALAVGILMIAGELDLSIGSVLGASSIMLAIGCTLFGINVWVMIGLTLATAAAIGLLNAFFVIRTGIPSLIVTLATNFGVSGAALGLSRLLTNTTSTSMVSDPLANAVFAARWGQASISIAWWIALTLIAVWVLRRTAFGNWIYATGGNLDGARGAGVPTARVKVTLFVTTALAASLVGIMQTIEFHSGNAANGQGYVFQAPIVAVIGGVLLTGGYGSGVGIAFGAALYGIISVGIFYSGWNTDWIQLFLGALLVSAVMVNSQFRRLSLSVR